DLDGVQSTVEVPNFPLFEDRESVHDFRVPPRLASLIVRLEGSIRSITSNSITRYSDAANFTLNGIDRTDRIDDMHLAKFGDDFVLELLGRTGEVKADRPIQFQLTHRDFREKVSVSLKTDAAGRIVLGPLTDITHVTAQNPEDTSHTWSLPRDHATYPSTLHAKVGDPLKLPYTGVAGAPERREFALFRMIGSTIVADEFANIALTPGTIELKNLAAGDYEFWLKARGERIRVRIVDGNTTGGYVVGASRHMELPGLTMPRLGEVTVQADAVQIRVADASKFTRVHVLGTRYIPEYSAFGNLGKVRGPQLTGLFPSRAESSYLTGRNIGDEYRYVLERINQKKYPGIMVERPQLLLNPWAIRVTDTGEQVAELGEEFQKMAVPAPSAAALPAPAAMGAIQDDG
ncbi:MAG: hypothetical protein ACRCZF_26650, partial [Gemmataceae bacterium]